ncbi:hypothetical protein BN863_3060 [Formosa agariphila KMM 3901]|uniref:Uncharacterized protein n=1 Tax=Formosa agariphila (strain DSM 15362 / KCTC 12365 / LMG 23005 / KMM 3901 / M-2Alg 35-1) TaxID=1347342 RepID=T2KHX5_FORAG|nr:hypothetical protein BN863_3060 [Formosa agariphila KMM 3901]
MFLAIRDIFSSPTSCLDTHPLFRKTKINARIPKNGKNLIKYSIFNINLEKLVIYISIKIPKLKTQKNHICQFKCGFFTIL